MAVRYDREGFAGVGFYDTLREALDSAKADGCTFASIGEHPKSVQTRHFAYGGDGWREVSGEELDRLRGLEDPRMLFRWSA